MKGQTIIIALLLLIVAKLYPNWWVYTCIAMVVLALFFALKASIGWLLSHAMPVVNACMLLLFVSFLAFIFTLVNFAKHAFRHDASSFDFIESYYSSINFLIYLAIAGVIVAGVIYIVEFVISFARKVMGMK